MSKNFGKATDLIDFSRSSGGTALRKIAYGPELVTNGTFDSDATGTTPATWEANSANASLIKQADGTALFSSTSFGYVRLQNASRPVLPVGVYEVSFNISEWSAGLLNVHVGLDTSGNVVTGNGSYSYLFESTAEQVYEFQLRPNSGGTGSFKIDNISIKEVLFDQADGDLVVFNHPADIPRIEYAADGSVKGLLVEESRTNLLTYSEDFTDGYWTKGNTSTLAIDAIGPDGQTLAVTLVDSGATGSDQVYISKSITVATSTTYTVSMFAKEDQLSWLAIGLFNFTSVNGRVWFDLSTGVVGTEDAGITGNIQAFGNGWYRCSATFTSDVADTSGLITYQVCSADNTIDVDLDGTSSILIYGAQLEAGAFPTSYIPTSGATATRSADVASIATSAFGYRQDEGSVVVDVTPVVLSSRNIFNLNTSGADATSIYSNADASGHLVVRDTTTQVNLDAGTFVAGQQSKISIAIKTNDFAVCIDGGAVAVDGAGSTPYPITSMSIGTSAPKSSNINGHIKSIKYYPRRLTDAQLQELTT